jgi:hypothetical protein
MVVFVHLGKQIDGTNDYFAFFSTLKDCFIKIGGDQIFSSVEDLHHAFEISSFTNEQRSKIVGALPHHLKTLHSENETVSKKKGKLK